jgi:Uma2 family endonuclease
MSRYRFNREHFHKLDERGAFDGLRVELVDGEIIIMAPMDEAHAVPVERLNRQLIRNLSDEYRVRPQLPFAPDDENELEPDLAVLSSDEPEGDTPTHALLAIEVSHSTVRDDLQRKARIYASAGVPEHWVIDVKKREVVVHKSPTGGRYRSVRHVADLAAVKSSAVPGLVLDLRNIFVKR